MSSSTIYYLAEIPSGKTAKDVLSAGYHPDEDEMFERMGGVADYVCAPNEYAGQEEEYLEDLECAMPAGVFQRNDDGTCELVFTKDATDAMLQKQLDAIQSAAKDLTLDALKSLAGWLGFAATVNYKYGYWFATCDEHCLLDVETESDFIRYIGQLYKGEARFAIVAAARYHM